MLDSKVDPDWLHDIEKVGEFVTLMDADDRLLYVNHPQPGRVEEALELSETTLRSLINNSPDTILCVDRARKILSINRDELGFQMDRIIGAPAESFVPEADR